MLVWLKLSKNSHYPLNLWDFLLLLFCSSLSCGCNHKPLACPISPALQKGSLCSLTSWQQLEARQAPAFMCGGTRREICHHSVPSHQHQRIYKYFSVHVCKWVGGSSGVTIDLYSPTPDPGSHAVTQESLVMLCVQSKCPRLLSPACGVPSAAPEAKPMVLVEVYLLAFILHLSVTASFEHLLHIIKGKSRCIWISHLPQRKRQDIAMFLCCSGLIWTFTCFLPPQQNYRY